MPARHLTMIQALAGALIAPLHLPVVFWKKVAWPVVLFVLLSLALPYIIPAFRSDTARILACVLLLMPVTKFMVACHRALLSPHRQRTDPAWWSGRETRYLAALLALSALSAAVAYLLLRLGRSAGGRALVVRCESVAMDGNVGRCDGRVGGAALDGPADPLGAPASCHCR